MVLARSRIAEFPKTAPDPCGTLAQRTGIAGLRGFVESAEDIMQRVEHIVPNNFPERVIKKVTTGVRRQAQRF